MPNVTVQGAHHSVVTLNYDSDETAVLARQVAALIQTGITDGTIVAADNKDGPPPTLPPGVTGELELSASGTTLVPKGYDYIVDAAKTAVVFGNGDANEQVLAGVSQLSFYATGGSGAVIAGGGKDVVSIPSSDKGAWLVALGNGDDSVRALGGGNDTISLGKGHDYVQLGDGSTLLTTNGSDTVLAASGKDTIVANGSCANEVVYGNASQLFFVATGPATVFGGSGSDTVFGGSGKDLLEGGSKGGNFLQAGSGPATLFGGGNGDQLYAGGSKQQLHAAGGNETLSGVAGGGSDTYYGGSGSDQIFGASGKQTFVAGTGAATVTANAGSKNLFEFMKSSGGGTELVTGLTDASQVHIDLVGYASNEVQYALAHQQTKDGSVTVTLSDHTKVTFQNISGLTAGNFTDDDASGGGSKHHWTDPGKHGWS